MLVVGFSVGTYSTVQYKKYKKIQVNMTGGRKLILNKLLALTGYKKTNVYI